MDHPLDHRLVIGLGNPGPEFANTYHNVGALAVAWLAAQRADQDAGRSGAAPEFRPYKDLFASYRAGTTTFVHPLVYMNDSGIAVREAMKVHAAGPGDIVILHDDTDLAIGAWKRVIGGRSAGHKGIQSIIDHIGTDAFARIKIGIRDTDEPHRRKAGDFVLSSIRARDREILARVFSAIGTETQ